MRRPWHRTLQVCIGFAIGILPACCPIFGGIALAADTSTCTSLATAAIPASAIGLKTGGVQIKSATLEDPDAATEYCKVLGAIRPVDAKAPDINFEVNLPTRWNGKALHFGGGGYDGVLITGLDQARFGSLRKPTPLHEGFVTFGSDSGHQGSIFDGSFGLNDEALDNFAGSQLKKTHDVALALVKARYGRLPARVYFDGNSQGGHEGFLVIQRWPEDYDGVIAIHPVYDFTPLQLSGNAIAKAIYAPGAWLSPAKVAALQVAVMKACDGLDGVTDGLISNVAACGKTFVLASMRCIGGGDSGDTCLSDAQIAAIRTIAAPLKFDVVLAGGLSGFPQWPILEGGDLSTRFNLGHSAKPMEPPQVPNDAFVHVMGDQMIRFMVARDKSANSLAFDPTAHAARLKALSSLVDASSVDIEKFEARGGKLLLMHGTADMAVSPHNTMDYYRRLATHFGQDRLDTFVRFYVAPGFGHGDGPFKVSWDSLGALDAWVDKGVAPEDQIAIDANTASNGRSRPLCLYPAWPKYKGTGDIASAASFVCTRE